jgi:hypothetical protein
MNLRKILRLKKSLSENNVKRMISIEVAGAVYRWGGNFVVQCVSWL